MALKGNLRDFSFSQLLNLISLAKKTGTLEVHGPDKNATVSFDEGKLSYAQNNQYENGLAAVLLRTEKLTDKQYQVIKDKAENIGDKELGLMLINSNYVTQDEILASLKQEFVSTANDLFTWAEGIFQFENNIKPSSEKILLLISLENIIIEGSRQLQEKERLEDEIPSLDMALKFTETPGTNIRNVNLSVKMRQIARTTKLNEFEFRRIVYSLIQAGLVEIIRPEGTEPPSPKISTLPVESPAEQKSLVNRLITRIRSL